jgi:hypothetical protein
MVTKAADINVDTRSYKHVRCRSDVENRWTHRVFYWDPYSDWYIIRGGSVGDRSSTIQTKQ